MAEWSTGWSHEDLMELSRNPHELILNSLNPTILCQLALLSDQDRRLVREYVKISPIWIEFANNHKIHFHIPATRLKLQEPEEYYCLTCTIVEVQRQHLGNGVYASPLSIEAMDALTEMIENYRKVFDVEFLGLKVDVDYFKDFQNYAKIWEAMGTVGALVLHGKLLRRVRIDEFIEFVDITRTFSMEMDDGAQSLLKHYVWLKNLEILRIDNAMWFDDHCLQESNNRMLEVSNTQVTAAGMNRWMHQWMDSKDIDVEEITVKKGNGRYTLDEVLRGLEYETQKQLIFKYWQIAPFQTRICHTGGGYIVKRSDGAYASVNIKPTFVHYTLYYPNEKKDN